MRIITADEIAHANGSIHLAYTTLMEDEVVVAQMALHKNISVNGSFGHVDQQLLDALELLVHRYDYTNFHLMN